MTLNEFLHMGGYAFYVWTSYGITFLVLAANLIAPIIQRRKNLKRIERLQRRAQEQL